MSKKKEKVQKLHKRSKKYSQNAEKIKEALLSEGGVLELDKAVSLAYQLEPSNFKDGPSVELHVRLNIDPTKSDQQVRGSVILPHGTGKKVQIAAFVSPEKESEAKKAGADYAGGDELIEKIKKENKIFFDKAIAEPSMMKKLPAIARILGVAGVMPNPKTGSVGENIEEMIKTIKAGKVDFKNDKSGNLHFVVGRLNKSFNQDKILENIKEVIDVVRKSKPEAVKKKYILSANLSLTTSPNIPLSV